MSRKNSALYDPQSYMIAALIAWTILTFFSAGVDWLWLQYHIQVTIFSHGVIWLAGLFGIYTIYRHSQKQFQKQEDMASAMIKSQEEYRTILQTAIDGFWQVNADGYITDVNDAYCQMSGYSRKELLQMNISQLDMYEKNADVKKRIERIETNTSDRFETIHRRKDGALFNVEVSARYLETGKFFGFLRDITECKENEKRLNESQRIARLGSWQLDIQKNILLWSDEIYRIFGIEPQAFKATYEAFLDAIHPEDREMVNLAYSNSLKTKTPYNIAHRLLIKDGSIKFVLENCQTFYDENGQPLYSSGTVQDITERYQIEQALRASEEKFSKAFHHSPILITLSEIETGRYIEVNEKFLQVSGFLREEVIGKTSVEIGWITREARETIRNEITTRGEVRNLEITLCTKSGAQIICNYSGVIIEVENRKLLLSIAEDITERKRTENQLRENEASLKQSQSVAHVGHWSWDTQTNTVIWSDEMKRIFGVEPETFNGDLNKVIEMAIHPEDKEKVNAANNSVLTAQKPASIEYRVIWMDGSVHTIWAVPSGRVTDENGNILKLTGIVQDITERKRAEEFLHENKMLLEQAQRVANLGYYLLDVPSGIWESSEILDDLFGIEKDYPKNIQSWAGVIHPDEREEMTAYFANEVLRTRNNFDREYKIKRIADGQIRWVHGMGELQFDARGNPIRMIGTIQDITERRKSEEALRHSEEKFRKAFIISPDSININRLKDGMYVTINQGFTDIMGYTPEECIGKTSSELNIWDSPENRQMLVEGLLKRGEVQNLEARFRSKNGDIKYGLMSASILELDGVKHIISVTRDITERKRSEDEILGKSRELEALFNISAHLRTAQTVEEMIPMILQQMAQIFKADANALILLDEDRKHFTYTLGDGMLASNTGTRFSAEDSISGLVMKTLEPYVTLDFSNDPNRTRALNKIDKIGAATLVPLQSEFEFVGVLLCARTKESPAGAFTPAEVKLLTAIGEMVGNAMRRAKLYDDALSRLQRVQALRAIDAAINANMDSIIALRVLLNQILSLMKVDATAVLLYNPATHMLEYATAQGFQYRDIENAYLKLIQGFAKTAIIERRLITVPNLAQAEDQTYKELALKEGFTSCYIIPMVAKGQVCGILEVYSRKTLTPNQEWLDFLEALGGQAAIAINNAQLFTNLERTNLELSIAYDATITGWSQALELRDKETEGHALRVTDWTVTLAKLAGLNESEIVHVRRGALLHDIGKMGIPDHILNKAGELTPQEWKIMRQHTQYAYDMLSPITFLRPAIDIPYSHHERWDGTGYPLKLKGEQIPFVARLFAVIDVWDAITSNRPYRKAWGFKKAIAHIQSGAGKHFDPKIVNLFVKEIERFTRKNMKK
jgi:PAS domain S-box-containing protein